MGLPLAEVEEKERWWVELIEHIRRVVMGEPRQGESVFTHVEEVEPLRTDDGGGAWFIWGWDELPALPSYDVEPFVPRSGFPPPGGLRIMSVGPLASKDDGVETGSAAEAFDRLIQAEPFGRVDDPHKPGMHQTDSIDIGIVISGEVTIEATDGSEVVLRRGDVYVQNGAQHRWRPNPDNPAQIVFVILNAQRRPSSNGLAE